MSLDTLAERLRIDAHINLIQFSKYPQAAGNEALTMLRISDLPKPEINRLAEVIAHQVAMQARRLKQLEHLRGR